MGSVSVYSGIVVILSRPTGNVTLFFFFQAEDVIRDADVTGVQTCALPISAAAPAPRRRGGPAIQPPLHKTAHRGHRDGGRRHGQHRRPAYLHSPRHEKNL